ncbi:flagellar hook-length control protein FliK [Candidatus Puniceispirillum sp.]|uniref:flagellar hook-length control protein FliK n=1 Tax=Candidatus Puniceispirillum sp. TaxID=2026719 RepID=UPI001ECAD9D7|nr:flagellar hook-length control protein FliK [Candidatus Puniceispirillum sp.]
MTTIDSSAKSGMVLSSGNGDTSSPGSDNAALFETLFGLMQTAADIPDAMNTPSADNLAALDTDLGSLPAIIASVPLGSVESGDGNMRLIEHMNSFMTPLAETSNPESVPDTLAAGKTEISDGALAMAQTLLVAQSVGLIDAVDDPHADSDTPATLDLKIGSPMSMMKNGHHYDVPNVPVAVPAELFAKARALVKAEVNAPSRNNYDTGPQPVHQLMNFLKQAVVPKDEKQSRIQALKTPLTDDAMPNIIGKSNVALVTYDVPHTVLTTQDMAPKSAPMPAIMDNVVGGAVTYNESHNVLTAHQLSKLNNTAPMPNIIVKSDEALVTYDAPHTVLTAQDLAGKAATMPNIIGKSDVALVTYDASHTVLTAQDLAGKAATMPHITTKMSADIVSYSEAHTVVQSKAELKTFDVVQSAKQDKAQISTVIESGIMPAPAKDVAARASIIVDNGAIRMHSEKPVTQRLATDSAGTIQTNESNNESSSQSGGNKGDGGGFDQASRGNSQTMTAHRLNMTDKAWQQGFVRRIENSIKNGSGEIRIALEPRQLGRMQVKLGFNGDATRIQITTETAAAAALLSEGENRLSQMLDQAGLRLGNLQTNSSGASGFDQNNNLGGQANSGHTGTSSGNDDQAKGKNQSQTMRGEVDNAEETTNTLENDNKTVLNILA